MNRTELSAIGRTLFESQTDRHQRRFRAVADDHVAKSNAEVRRLARVADSIGLKLRLARRTDGVHIRVVTK